MRILNVHAHYDDFEFTAAGTFELWRRQLGASLHAKVIVCTDGASGHQFRTRAETARLRLREQRTSARLGGYEFELLRYPDGRVPREACLEPNPPLLAALWKAIRDFQPDYLFCPPLPGDVRAGVHVDHLVVAEAVRRVAYLINVPHVFTPEYPADETRSRPCRVPVILNVYDGYMSGTHGCDLAVDVEPAFDYLCAASFCHGSQIQEWLPWVGRHAMSAPEDLTDWKSIMRARLVARNRQLRIRSRRAVEVFALTAWGESASAAQLRRDFPNVLAAGARPVRALSSGGGARGSRRSSRQGTTT